MCGFVAMLLDDPDEAVDERDLVPATDALIHRGPDDGGYFTEGPVGFGFRRLAILDLSPAGHQPMHSSCGRYVIVFNGEIYNFIELRAELESAGDTFRSGSDTEVILAAFRRWGTGCFERFNGMWAICIWDRERRVLTASRDRFGIKPLYIAHRRDRWLLGSELPALGHLDPLPRLPNLVVATDYLQHGFMDYGTATAIDGYQHVPPSTTLTLRSGDQFPTITRFYDVSEAIDYDRQQRIAEDTTGRETELFAAELRDTIIDAVRLRLRADVPVGTCLSGGLDSASIVCATARVAAESRASNARHAFSAMMREFDESPYIRAVTEQTGVKLTTADVSDASIAATAEQMLRHHDEPVHSLTPIAGSLVFKAAREQGVTVLLNGQGADELLAGYGSFVPQFVHSVAGERGLAAAWSQWQAEGVRQGDALVVARQLMGGFRPKLPGILKSWRGQSSSMVADAILGGTSDRGWLAKKAYPVGLQAALDEALCQFPLPLFLRVEDRNAMSWSREARLPYLDPRVVKMCRTAPASIKRRAGLNKWIQREALRGVIPEVVRARPDKMGFPSPHARWLRGPLRDLVMDTLSEDRLRKRGIYAVDRVLQARDAMLADTGIGGHHALLRVFLYEGWARRHLDV